MSESSSIVISLPWPPSVNRYWRRNGNCYFISAAGIAFRANTIQICSSLKASFSKEQRLFMVIDAYPPDRRRRDLDNILKAIGDSLQHAGIYHDDNQIDGIHIERMPTLEGKVVITIDSI